ncbi:DUF202 domain-containing protein [Paenibacillus sp. JX-17]|uniref:DUF202 domain-containing protein n=1 Tax=Paenibacillus lacisoli TaxID=3064525 RepID=A0ABT9CBQ5_9BACL|nr:DUF202 domain-containing protein [Paenibacillus sp. JX-17]MDO7906692.1 DUF202 domain-containing protein [Paenibacillus sp. JX-17]
MNDNPESKYIQQHLANERTFLAWVRTCIAIIGLGFLAAGLLLRTHLEHWIGSIVGIGAVLLGGITLGMATYGYFKKRKAINEDNFHSPVLIVLLAFFTLGLISLLLAVLVMIMVI